MNDLTQIRSIRTLFVLRDTVHIARERLQACRQQIAAVRAGKDNTLATLQAEWLRYADSLIVERNAEIKAIEARMVAVDKLDSAEMDMTVISATRTTAEIVLRRPGMSVTRHLIRLNGIWTGFNLYHFAMTTYPAIEGIMSSAQAA